MFIPPGYANLQLLFTSPGGRNALTSHGCTAEALNPEMLNNVTNLWAASDYWENMDDSWVFNGARLVIGTSVPSEPITWEHASSTPGGNSGTSAPPNCAMLLRKHTERGGRKGRGRMYIPGVTADSITDAGTLGGATSTFELQLQDVLTDMFGALNSADPVLLHQDEADGDPDVVTRWELDSMVATQRHRLRG